MSPTPLRAGSRFMALLRIAVNPTTGACIPLAPETVFSNLYILQNYKKIARWSCRKREGVREKPVLPPMWSGRYCQVGRLEPQQRDIKDETARVPAILQTISIDVFPKILSQASLPNINSIFANRIIIFCLELWYPVEKYSTRCSHPQLSA